MILIHLGFTREHLQRSDPATDIAHGCQVNDRTQALCGVELHTSFENILFGIVDGTNTDNQRTHQPGGTPRCLRCREIIGEWS